MIKISKESQKLYKVERDGREITELKLISSSVTNKFHIITGFVENVSETIGDEFDNWFEDFLIEYRDDVERRYDILKDNVVNFKRYVDLYIENSDINFDNFVDQSKVKKSSILFMPDEIRVITELSGYLKLYAIISNTETFKIDQRLHKKIYNRLAEGIIGTEIVKKIFDIVKTKTFRYNLTDKYMWDYIKMVQCKSIDDHVNEIFNFIMNSILILCEEDKNPITYFVSVVEESVKWFLRSVYKSSIIYEDSVATENIHSLSANNLKTYSYNDTLGRLKGIAFDQIYRTLEKDTLMTTTDEKDKSSDEAIVTFQNRCSDIKFVSPICDCLVFPLLAKITNIPYSHFKTLSPEHAAILSCYIQNVLRRVFKNEYKNLFFLLEYYPTNPPALTTTYQIKLIHDYINTQNEVKNFFGFDTKIIPNKILSFFIGRISRINFCNIYDGKKLAGVPLSKIEADMIKFYTYMFAGNLEKEVERMSQIINIDF